MAKKKFDDDDDDFDELDDSLLDEEPNEDNIESAMQARDYSSRRILIWENDASHLPASMTVLQDLLTGATIRAVSKEEEGLALMEAEEWDTYVVDFMEPGVSQSEFVKQVNNQPDAILVAVGYQALTLGNNDERNRFKLEPLRKLFDVEKVPKPKAP